jgi:anti-sigma factor (TIGR02949 family)
MQDSKYECKDVVELLSEYIDGECSSKDRDLIEAHLADCPNCITFVNTFRKSISMAKNLLYIDIPEDLRERLHKALDEKASPRRSTRPTTPPPFVGPEKGMEDEDRI